MRVSGLIITHQLSKRAAAWLAKTATVLDEIIAVVVEDRAAPGLIDLLEGMCVKIFRPKWSNFYPSDEDSREMIAACAGDWILKIDHDEELSAEWFSAPWRSLLEETEFTHFWLQRRWTISPHEYLDGEPWWPDWQLRLFRNQPSEMTFARQLHESMQMRGPGGFLRTLALHHHDIWLASRAEREAKAQIYEQLRPGRGLGHFYLHEDWDVTVKPLPTTSAFVFDKEILRMETLPLSASKSIALQADPPRRFFPGELCWTEVCVQNNSASTLCAGSPFPINLGYHWLHLPSRAPAIDDAPRTAILPELAAGSCASWKMFLIAPSEPGEYILQITMVQEHVRWLEAENENFAREFRCTVRAVSEALVSYATPAYAESLREFSEPRLLPQSGASILQRPIPETEWFDAIGSYPLFACRDWNHLAADLDALAQDLVSLTVVPNPMANLSEAFLREIFPDQTRPFKTHFIANLEQPARDFVSEHHRYYAQRALKNVCVELVRHPPDFLADWCNLYAQLVQRRDLHGVQAFSQQAFAAQLALPGAVVFKALHQGEIVAAHFWLVDHEIAYSHLAAANALGYQTMASYALYWTALDYFATHIRYLELGGGAGLETQAHDGLARFKRGWSNETRTVFLCGRIFQPEKYRQLCAQKKIPSATNYFPAYRANEIR